MPSAGIKKPRKDKFRATPQIIKRYQRICRKFHKNSAVLFPKFVMWWHSMEDFAKALEELERQAVMKDFAKALEELKRQAVRRAARRG